MPKAGAGEEDGAAVPSGAGPRCLGCDRETVTDAIKELVISQAGLGAVAMPLELGLGRFSTGGGDTSKEVGVIVRRAQRAIAEARTLLAARINA